MQTNANPFVWLCSAELAPLCMLTSQTTSHTTPPFEPALSQRSAVFAFARAYIYNRYSKGALLLILLLALFTSCSSGDSQATEPVGIEGLWTLSRVEGLSGDSYDYPNSSGTFLLLVDGDSAMYVCHWAQHAKGNVLLPTCRMTYTLIDKGVGENIFLLNGNPRPLQLMGDTAFCFSY